MVLTATGGHIGVKDNPHGSSESVVFDTRPTALVVDDDTSYRQTISEILTEDGWKVVEASTGEEALSFPNDSAKPRVLVTDINLGSGMDGWTLARLAKNQWPQIGLLFISGMKQPAEPYHHLFSGHFLLKPFFLSDFLVAVTEAIRSATAGSPI